MHDQARILIVDDQEAIRTVVDRYLSENGFECECAGDLETAICLLRTGSFDLLISDIKMPGNENLEFIKSLPDLAPGIPVILMTGYPELESAIQSIDLGVVGYLVKPFEPGALMDRVQFSLQNSRVHKVLASQRQRLQDWRQELTALEAAVTASGGPGSAINVQAFIDLTFRNIIGSIFGLKGLTEAVTSTKYKAPACEMMNCPQLVRYRMAIQDSIDTLERTKHSFKSKELAELRKRLEELLKNQK
jgi:CheY-like chemotaxis protein